MNQECENQTSSKAADLLRPMTKYVMKEKLDLSFDFLEDENASEPCYSIQLKGEKKVNLLRFAAIVGGVAVMGAALMALCRCGKRC